MAFVPISAQAVFAQGYPVSGAQVFAYDTLTTNPRDLFMDAALTTKHPCPVVAVDGVLPVMWAGAGNYDLHILGPDDGQIRTLVGLRGDTVAAATSTAFDITAQLRTGDIVVTHGTGSRTGWVRCNGLTIGSGSSAGTERANADCQALFVFLWTQDPSLIVSGGRSAAGAQADWAAGKTIALPDDQARVELGTPDMGNATASAGRLTGGAIPTGGVVLGSVGGEAAHALAATEVGGTTNIATAGSIAVVTAAGGAAHNTLPPFVARTRYLKL